MSKNKRNSISNTHNEKNLITSQKNVGYRSGFGSAMEVRDKHQQKTNQTTDDNFDTLNIKEKEIHKIPLLKDNRIDSRITTINKSRRSK